MVLVSTQPSTTKSISLFRVPGFEKDEFSQIFPEENKEREQQKRTEELVPQV